MGAIVKNLLKNIKFLIERNFSNPVKIKGKCKACGECCRSIVFYAGKYPVKTEEQFELLKKWDKRYNNFEPNGVSDDGLIYFKCKSLKNDGKCKVYFFRSLACRMYPKFSASFFTRGYDLKSCCGYYVEPQKKFSDFLNKD